MNIFCFAMLSSSLFVNIKSGVEDNEKGSTSVQSVLSVDMYVVSLQLFASLSSSFNGDINSIFGSPFLMQLSLLLSSDPVRLINNGSILLTSVFNSLQGQLVLLFSFFFQALVERISHLG